MDHLNQLKSLITQWSIELGFDDIGISDINIQEDERHLNDWLNNCLLYTSPSPRD